MHFPETKSYQSLLTHLVYIKAYRQNSAAMYVLLINLLTWRFDLSNAPVLQPQAPAPKTDTENETELFVLIFDS
jgi:hypothetical protein